jgi:DNA-binding winged helix-turn-helix (wHTH) protein
VKPDTKGRSPRSDGETPDTTDIATSARSETPALRPETEHNSVVSFGPYRFNRDRRLLLDRGNPVRLGARALAILIALTETPGRLVSKEELFERAWSGLTVDETNVKFQISGLRKALRDYGGLIRAEASLGYRFVGAVGEDYPGPRWSRAGSARRGHSRRRLVVTPRSGTSSDCSVKPSRHDTRSRWHWKNDSRIDGAGGTRGDGIGSRRAEALTLGSGGSEAA